MKEAKEFTITFHYVVLSNSVTQTVILIDTDEQSARAFLENYYKKEFNHIIAISSIISTIVYVNPAIL